MNSIVFTGQMNDFCRRYLIKSNEHLVPNSKLFETEYRMTLNTIGEMLLYYDGIALRVYGENIPLALLINNFGIKGVEELLEQEALQFVLWTPSVTYLVDDIPGVHPLQSGAVTSECHSNPEVSAELGLNFLRNKPPRSVRRNLIRKVVKKYKVPPNTLSAEAVKFGHDGYEANLFSDLGLQKKKNITELNQDERKRLCHLATVCLELAVLGEYKYISFNNEELAEIQYKEEMRLKDANILKGYSDTIFEVEKAPNFCKMIQEDIIKLSDIPRIRNTHNAKRFRSWINNLPYSADKQEVIREYLYATIGVKSFWETNQGKFIKMIGIMSATSILGGAINGFTGATVGALAGPIVDFGINVFDTYYLDNLLKGWKPKNYFDYDINGIIRKKRNVN